MLAAVTSSISTVLGWIGTVVTSLTDSQGDLHDLLPLLAVGIAISAVMLGVKMIRNVTWAA